MLPAHNRKDYLKDALDPNMVAYAALTRNAYFGFPAGLINIITGGAGVNWAQMVRTTILPEGARKRDPKERAAVRPARCRCGRRGVQRRLTTGARCQCGRQCRAGR